MKSSNGVRRYRSRRLVATGSVGGSCAATVHLGEPITAGDVTPLQQFLTRRWRLYTRAGGSIATALAEHAPWHLRDAIACDVDAALVAACGLPYPTKSPLVFAADNVHARLTGLRRCATNNPNVRAA